MARLRFIKKVGLVISSLALGVTMPISAIFLDGQPVYADSCGELADTIGGAGGYSQLSYLPSNYSYYSYLARPKGVSLDQAATFMQDMSDITGAYYDQATDRVVLVGTKNTSSTPVFNKDDFAVAVRSLVFDDDIPEVSIGDTWTDEPTMQVTFNGQLENTNFGSVIENADYMLKQYFFGFYPNLQPVTSSVPSYRSAAQRYLDQIPAGAVVDSSRMQIVPKDMELQEDNATNSFVFNQATMQVVTTPLSDTNQPEWNNAASAWAQDLTNNYDAYAQEIPSWEKTEELAKVVSVVKWLKDNNIATDYAWAKNYTPKVVPTDTALPTMYTSLTEDGETADFEGGVAYSTPNTYATSSSSTASDLESTTEAAAPSADASNWTYTQGGQQYQAVAVSADAFRSVGAYTTKTTDVSIKTDGNTSLDFSRVYDSQDKDNQTGIGNGWDWTPASLTTGQNWNTISDSPAGGYSGLYYANLIYQDIDGDYETFTYDPNTHTYIPDKPNYHTLITRNTDGSYTVTATDQTSYTFGDDLALLAHNDKNGNGIYYEYGNPNATYITAIDDDNGNTLTINHDANGMVTSVVDWAGRTTTYGYDGAGNLTSVTDPNGNAVHYTYDSSNRLATITDRLGRQVLSNTYNDDDKVTQSTNGSGLTVNYTYDTENRVITATDNNGNTTKTYYDDQGRETEQDDPYGNATMYTYGTEAQPLTVKDKRNDTTTYTYDDNGNVTSVTYSDNTQINYQYNSQNLVTQVTDGRYSPAKVTSYTYDTKGNMLTKDEAGQTTTYTYDLDSGDMLSSTDSLGHKTKYTYNDFGDVTKETSPLSAATQNTYDSLGRLTQSTDPQGNATTYTYDNDDNVLTTADSTGTTTNSYDVENELTSSVDPNALETQYSYDSAKSQTSTEDALTHLTSYGYDEYDNMVSKEDALTNTTQYVYDKLDRATQATDPLGKIKKWQYGANGNITQSTDEDNRVTSYAYDSMNRLSTATYPDNTTATYTYDDRGNITQLVDHSGTTAYTYDDFDRLTSETDPNGNTVNYGYDDANNLTQITYPGSKTVNYSYDAANQLRTVSDWNSANTYYQYNPNGSLASTTLPNGIVGVYAYDSSNKLSSLTYAQNQNLISKYSYTRNANGNITNETDSTLQSPTTYTIYDDALHTNWSTSWSWDSNVSAADTSNPQSGTKDVSWKLTGGGGGLHMRSTSGMIDITPYNTISFAMKATQSGQRVGMDLKDANDNNLTTAPIDIGLYGAHPNANGYTTYNIPLSVLDGGATQVSGLDFVDLTNAAQPKMYIDNIKLTTATASPLTMYYDGLAPKFVDWSWDATNNFSDTAQPYQGNDDIATNITAPNGGLLLYRSSGFFTTGYNYLSFALKGSQAGQDFSIQLSDTNGNGIGSELDLASYGEPVDANNYTVYNVPLADLQGTNKKVYGIVLQDQKGLASQQINVDEVKLMPSMSTNTADQQVSYTYDDLGRLTSAQYPSATYEYTYDAAGNRSSVTLNSATTNASFNDDNELTSLGSHNFTYDNEGNETGDGSKTYSYDYANNLTGSTSGGTSVGYKYNAQGQRLSESVNSTPTYQFVSNTAGPLSQLLETKNVTNSTQTYYTYGGPSILSQGGTAASSRQYFLVDGMGNVRSLTDTSGNNIESYSYDPFGAQTSGDSTANFTYQGQLADPQTGLIYLRARYYDPTTGTFLSRDPQDGTLQNPRTQNGYSYADDNPINMTDPSGSFSVGLYTLTPGSLLGAIGNLFSGGSNDQCSSVLDGGYGSLKVGANATEARAEAEAAGISIPKNYVATRATNGKGWVFKAPGNTGNGNAIRVMEPTATNPTGDIRLTNSAGQYTDMYGNPVSRMAPEGHIDLPFDE